MSERKLAFVCSGGGMRCAFTAGAMVALAKEFGVTSPDIIIAASGSVGTAYYYCAKQYDAIERIWTKHLATNHFVSLLTYKPNSGKKFTYWYLYPLTKPRHRRSNLF